jgi:hypothetical protein
LAFSNAVPLRERISGLKPEHPTVTAGALGIGAAVGADCTTQRPASDNSKQARAW